MRSPRCSAAPRMPGQLNVSASVPPEGPQLLNALGFSLPAGQQRERERRPARPSRAPAALSARTPSQRLRRAATRKPSENQGRKGNGPEDRSSGPLLNDASREVRAEEEMAPRSLLWSIRL